MQFSQEILQKSSEIGSSKVASAFTKISGTPATVITSKVQVITITEALEKIKPSESFSIVVYAQLLSGTNGASFLILPRESALNLVDLLNQQPVGTTGILKDIDRSALKEILNILSNAYMTALSETAKINMGLGVPNMITSERLKDSVEHALLKSANSTDTAIVFETTTTINQFKITASLYLVFSESATDLVKE